MGPAEPRRRHLLRALAAGQVRRRGALPRRPTNRATSWSSSRRTSRRPTCSLPAPDERRLPGRRLTGLMPWARASGLLDALREVLETGIPLRIHEHGYEDAAEHGGRARPRSVSVGALRIEPGLLLVTLRPNRGTAGTDPAWEEKLHRLAGTGPWEWDVRSGTIYWYAQALAVLGSSLAPGPLADDQPAYTVHKDDADEHDAFFSALVRDGRSGHVEVRVLQPTGAVRHIRIGGDPVADPVGRGGARLRLGAGRHRPQAHPDRAGDRAGPARRAAQPGRLRAPARRPAAAGHHADRDRRPTRCPASRSPPATVRPARRPASAATGTASPGSPTAGCCCTSATWPGTASRPRPRWQGSTTRCTASP
jgi:hypothetical protein